MRCYLGASHGRWRRPNALTGFDPSDDFALSKLQSNFAADTKPGAAVDDDDYEIVEDDDETTPLWKQMERRNETKPKSPLGISDYAGPYPVISTPRSM